MTVEQLIIHLQKCDPKFEVRFLNDDSSGELIQFVELQNQSHTVLLRDETPNWEDEMDYESVSITVFHQEEGFASTSWK